MCEKCENTNLKKNLTSEVFDSRLRTYLQNTIRRLPLAKRIKLKTFEKCGKKLVPIADGNVVLMKKEGSARFFGVATCGNAFACPYCSAKIMAKHAANIGAAVDMLREKGKVAFMMTLTIRHFKAMSCLDVLELLSKTWRQFGTAVGRRSKDERSHTVFSAFKAEFNVTHWVKVIEFTYNDKKGWHPHIHALFWVDKNRLKEVAEWEEKLADAWDRIQLNSWLKRFANSDMCFGGKGYQSRLRSEKEIKETFHLFEKNNKKRRSLYISKNDDGDIREAQSSEYICGWGANSELTGNRHKKASGKGSLTMHQLLESAANGNREHRRRYMEFIFAIRERKRTRVRYAHGMKKEIDEYRKTHEYEEIMIKKNTEAEPKWRSLITLSKKTWYKILELEEQKNLYIRHNLLFLAANYDDVKAFVLIYEYLRCYDIDIVAENAINYNFYCDIAEQYYNGYGSHRCEYGDVAC